MNGYSGGRRIVEYDEIFQFVEQIVRFINENLLCKLILIFTVFISALLALSLVTLGAVLAIRCLLVFTETLLALLIETSHSVMQGGEK